MAKQLSVFTENRPGRLKAITETLYQSDKTINILAFTIQDRGEFGLVKLLVDKPEAAQIALTEKGFACALREVIVIEAKDKPGNLCRLTTALSDNNINIVDAHGYVVTLGKKGLCCLDCDKKLSEAAKVLEQAGFKVLSDEELNAF